MHLTSLAITETIKRAKASGNPQAREVNEGSVRPVWYPVPKGKGAWADLKDAYAMMISFVIFIKYIEHT